MRSHLWFPRKHKHQKHIYIDNPLTKADFHKTSQKPNIEHKAKNHSVLWNSLGIVTADLPENGIRPLIPSTQSLQSLLQQKPHLFFNKRGFKTARKFSFFRSNGVTLAFTKRNREREIKGKGQNRRRSIFQREFVFGELTTTARSSSSLFGPQSPAPFSIWI